MKIRQRAARTLALATAAASIVLAPVAAAASSAGQQAQPGFLAPQDLPPHPHSAWYAEPATEGLPDAPTYCLEDVLPTEGAHHRLFRTDLDTSAEQITVRTAGVGEARALAASARESVRGCAAATEEQDAGAEAEFRDYGHVDVQEGAHVYGIDTAYDSGSSDAHLFGVGRDGRTVTVVTWGQLGDLSQAPVEAFRGTTRTAVEKLRR
ncbi:hypothetical protein [Streptomyces sp. TR06-5]|uniref:hypothetical protein n=1 Tax=unclassified Streptomyces TaxID=2593676 RepID=UPI00399EEC23